MFFLNVRKCIFTGCWTVENFQQDGNKHLWSKNNCTFHIKPTSTGKVLDSNRKLSNTLLLADGVFIDVDDFWGGWMWQGGWGGGGGGLYKVNLVDLNNVTCKF